jgi:NitT/TauT family transport system substrate-binding protein
MMESRSLLRGIVVATATLACVLQTAAAQPSRTSITVVAPLVANVLPLYYAQRAGLFEKADLTIKIDAIGSGAAAAAAVAGGAADIGGSNIQTLIQGHVRGLPFTIVAPGAEYDERRPSVELLVLTTSPIRRPADIAGASIGVASLQDAFVLGLNAWISKFGIDAGSLRFVETPQSALLALLQQKRVDAILVSQPRLAEALASGTTRAIGKPYDAIAKHFLISTWFSTTTWVAAHPEGARRFSAAIAQADVYADKHWDEMLPIISDYTKVPVEQLKKVVPDTFGASVPAAYVQPMIDVAARFKVIDRIFPAAEIIATP